MLPAVPIPQLVDRLAELAFSKREHAALELPTCTFHLEGAVVVSGRVLAVASAGIGRCVLVEAVEVSGAASGALSYIDTRRIAVIQVLDAERHAHALSFDREPPPALPSAKDGPPPTRLAVKRAVAEMQQDLRDASIECELTLADNALAETGEPLRCLLAVLEDVVAALAQIQADELGQQALRGISTVTIGDGEARVTRVGGVIEATADLSQGALGRLSPQGVYDSICEQL